MRRPLVGLLLLLLLGTPVAAQQLRHRTTAPVAAPGITASHWNDSLVATGGVDGQVFVRDAGQTDGWRFGAAGVAGGGTGLTSYAIGDLLYASATSTLAKLAAVADGNVLRSAGLTTAPVWGKVRLSGATTDVTGTLPVTNGGTGLALYVAGDLLVASTTTTLATLTAAADGNVLRAVGAGLQPIYGKVRLSGATTDVTGTLPVASGGTGATTFTTNGVLYGAGTGAVLATAQGGANTVLTANAGAPSFSATPTVTSLTATGDVVAGSAGLLAWTSRARVSSPADSQVLVTNAAGTDFARLMFGGTSSSFPALVRSSTALHVKLADDSGFAEVRASFFSTATNPAASGGLRLGNEVAVVGRNAANNADINLIRVDVNNQVYLGNGTADIVWSRPTITMGGGATATLGTIGGSGPAAAGQAAWLRIIAASGAVIFVPVWQ